MLSWSFGFSSKSLDIIWSKLAMIDSMSMTRLRLTRSIALALIAGPSAHIAKAPVLIIGAAMAAAVADFRIERREMMFFVML